MKTKLIILSFIVSVSPLPVAATLLTFSYEFADGNVAGGRAYGTRSGDVFVDLRDICIFYNGLEVFSDGAEARWTGKRPNYERGGAVLSPNLFMNNFLFSSEPIDVNPPHGAPDKITFVVSYFPGNDPASNPEEEYALLPAAQYIDRLTTPVIISAEGGGTVGSPQAIQLNSDRWRFNIPDSGSTALLGILACGGLGFLRRFMRSRPTSR